MYQGNRDYNAIQNAGQNLVYNQYRSQSRGHQNNRYGNNNNYNYRNQNGAFSTPSETPRYEELNILDKYSQPLLQKGGDGLGNLSSIQLSSNKKNQPQNIRGSSANVRYNAPQVQMPYQQYPQPSQFYPTYDPQYSHRKKNSQQDVSKVLQNQIDKQNDILSQLINNIDKQKQSQPIYQQPQQQQPDYNYRLKEIEKEYQMMNEIQNLKREINSIQNQKTQVNPFLQQQQQMQMYAMQQQMMTPYQNPMMMLLMNQLGQQNNQQQNQQQTPPPPLQQPYGYPPYPPQYPPYYPPYNPYGFPPPQPPQNKQPNEQENRLEELLKDLLKEKALQNAIKNEQLDKISPDKNLITRNSLLSNIPSRRSSNHGQDQFIYTDPDQVNDDMQAPKTQDTIKTQQSVKKKLDLRRKKRIIGYFVLFIRWIRQEVQRSKEEFKQYEIEEFKDDFFKGVDSAIPWLIQCSTKGFNSIILNCKKEQDIVDIVVKKLNAKEQDQRFTDYTTDCDFLLDEITRGIETIPEDLCLFIVKKFYDNSYFSNNPPYFFQFELDRLQFDKNDLKLINNDLSDNSPTFKLLLIVLIFIKTYIPLILIAPFKQKLDPSLKFNQNYITLKKLSIVCSIFYHLIFDHLKANFPIVQKQVAGINALPQTMVVNNKENVAVQPINSTKDEMLSLLVTKDQLSTFYTKRQDWAESFKKKIDAFAVQFKKKIQVNRLTFLELRRELLYEKAKELQRFIPAKYRNVQLS